jgi:uncharacterized membrane-anchored protein
VIYRRGLLPEPVAAKVPAVTPLFWVLRLLITAGGVAAADYLARGSHVLAALAETGLLAAALAWQFQLRRCTAPAYWFLVGAVVIAGTGLSDTLHLGAGLPYAVTTLVWAAALTGVLAAWYRDPELTVATVDTRRREILYWAMMLTSFGFGAALADFAADTVNLGYASASLVFAAAVAVPVVDKALGFNSSTAFWAANMLTWPLGASVADYVSKTAPGHGLGFGDGRTALVFLAAVAVLAFAAAVELGRRRRSAPGGGRAERRAGRSRRVLRQAVGEAEFAVLAAQVTGVPTGELDTLCQRLRLAAETVGHTPSTADLLTAARMIQQAAAAAMAVLPASAEPTGDTGDTGRAGDARDQCAAIAALIARAARAADGDPRP